MGITKPKLGDNPFDGHFFASVVHAGDRMMGVRERSQRSKSQ
jgi:hypothetical protein